MMRTHQTAVEWYRNVLSEIWVMNICTYIIRQYRAKKYAISTLNVFSMQDG